MEEKAKLSVLLKHWIEHNDEHASEFREWAAKAKNQGEAVAGGDILEAVQRLEEASGFLKQALQKLG